MDGYMIFVEGKTGPTVMHGTEEEARAEALRLADMPQSNRKVYLLKVVDVLVPIARYKWQSEEGK